jgi:ribosomal protein S18 acetylase RimI-like enzyme
VLGRLAVHRDCAGRGLGGAMLLEAMKRTLAVAAEVGVRATMIHAIDDDALGFYARYGFQLFPPGSRTLFMPIETIVDALRKA